MDRKKILWSIVSLLLAACSVWAVIAQDKHFTFGYFVNFFISSDKRFLIPALFTMCGYFLFEGYALSRMAHRLGYGGSKTGAVYGAADIYFSAITPSATGGQPAAAYFMMRDGIPGAAATVMLLMNLVMFTVSIVVFGGLTVLTSYDLFIRFSLVSKVLIILGFLIISGLGCVFLLLLRKSHILYNICDKVIRFLGKIRIMKRTDYYRDRMKTIISEYKDCSKTIRSQKGLIIEVFILNMLQRASQIATIVLVYLSAGYGIDTAGKVWHIQNYTVLGSNCVPIPGAMGVADYIMLDGYSMIPEVYGSEAEMELICRSVSFYFCIVVCAIIILAGYFSRKMKLKNKETCK